MKSCNESCVPSCNCCLFSMRERIPYNGQMINGRCVGCFKGHHDIAISGGSCKDFRCMNAAQESKKSCE